ncbi:hypothetical protein CDD80_4618 [Ophiocordyceps camponoti-rufipedis]|uniref:SCP domain-containing protein n=1 Tax=Ophiocordyceps camponoti-rufipedis TaxID=2004952 RepID=A0A2C5ZEQ5_9HYPO|nr:hypothetical protein CDD80_4618 [Ophiocordyceps camponoti-rufipedis]
MARLQTLLVISWAAQAYSTSPIIGVNTFIPQWLIEVFPGQPYQLLNGTIQEVERKAMELNPRWHEYYIANSTRQHEQQKMTRRYFSSCTKFPVKSLNCKNNPQNWRPANVGYIFDGIHWLMGREGIPQSQPGPGTCGRVSCSYSSAIWWCNDDSGPKSLNSFTEIARGANCILDSCPHIPGGQHRFYTWGQVFHPDNWNVIVREDKHNC